MCGSMEADEFLGFVLVALADERDEAAVPAVEMPRPVDETGAPRGARFIDCGLPAGYVSARLRELADLATLASRLDRKVQWG